MKLDSADHNPSPVYLRFLLDRAGLSQCKAARLMGIPERTFRDYLSAKRVNSAAPYPVQFCLEVLAMDNMKPTIPTLRVGDEEQQ